MKIEIFTSPKFERRYKKLPVSKKNKAEKKETIFIQNPFDARLNTHKLHGKEKAHWAYSIDSKYRIKFLFLNNNAVLYFDIGTHDEVY